MENVFILPVAVIRRLTQEGAKLVRLQVLNNEDPDYSSMFWPECMETKMGDWQWGDILEDACNRGIPYFYYDPLYQFELDDLAKSAKDDERDFLSIVHPLIFREPMIVGILSKLFQVVMDERENNGGIAEFLGSFAALAKAIENAGSTELAILKTLSAIVSEIAKLNIPAVVPYGQSELEASGLL